MLNVELLAHNVTGRLQKVKAGWETLTVFRMGVRFVRIETLAVAKLCYAFPIQYKIEIPRSLSQPATYYHS